MASPRPLGEHLRDWRRRRRMSQLTLALEARISQRHLSFIESGRSSPSREMVLHLAERLDVPLRERNHLLLAAGFAPLYPQLPLDHPSLARARHAVDLVLKGHEPYPAIAVDRHWTLIAANAAVPLLLADIENVELLKPPVNVLRLSLHPQGLAPQIANLPEWRVHLLDRLRRQVDQTGDPVLARLLDELDAMPAPPGKWQGNTTLRPASTCAGVVVPLELASPHGRLAFFSTITVFGTPVDVTLSELALETFYPADDATAERLRHMLPSGR